MATQKSPLLLREQRIEAGNPRPLSFILNQEKGDYEAESINEVKAFFEKKAIPVPPDWRASAAALCVRAIGTERCASRGNRSDLTCSKPIGRVFPR